MPVPAGLEQEWHVKHYEAPASARCLAQKSILPPTHQGMEYGFQAGQGQGIVEDRTSQGLAVDTTGPVDVKARKSFGDGGDGRSVGGQQVVHHPVGVVHQHHHSAEYLGSPRLTHADRTGQAKDHHPLTLCFRIEPLEDVAA
jgi:hypothetical protein